MTENTTKEQELNIKRSEKDMAKPLTQNLGLGGLSVSGGCDVTPGLGIEFHQHKSQGLQSASDMWIDKSKFVDTLTMDEATRKNVMKLSRQ
jgi:hypothetical protein